MDNIWVRIASVGSLSGLATYMFYKLYSEFLSLQIFAKMSQAQTFVIMATVLVLVFLALWIILHYWHMGQKSSRQKTEIVAQGINTQTKKFKQTKTSKGITITPNKSEVNDD